MPSPLEIGDIIVTVMSLTYRVVKIKDRNCTCDLACVLPPPAHMHILRLIPIYQQTTNCITITLKAMLQQPDGSFLFIVEKLFA